VRETSTGVEEQTTIGQADSRLAPASRSMTTVGKLDGKVALITASGRNIGRATVLKFAAEGAAVVVNVRSNRDDAEAVAAEVRALGGSAIAIVADVSDQHQVNTMVAQTLAEFGRIDILVSGAATRPHKPFLELTAAEWTLIRGTVLDGALYCAQAVLPSMVASNSGSVVFIAGDGAWAGGAKRAHIGATKMALVGLCRALASEFAPNNIRCNVLSPGRVDTVRVGEAASREAASGEDHVLGIPLGRLGHVDDIASGSLFLSSDDSSWITGQTLHVNGGAAYF
jgi:3-oxoacyl-[acyl-carrier protein] reductase